MADKLELKVLFTAVDKFLRPVKAITQGASEASKALKANTERMKEFNRTIEQIDAFKKVERDAAIAANTFKATQSKIAALKEEMSKAGVPTKAMTDELGKLSKASEDLRQKHQGLVNTEQQLFGKLKAAGIDTRNLAEHRRQLASANAEATNSSRQLTAALEAENKKMQRLHAARAEFAKSRALAGKVAGYGAKALAVGAGINAAASVPVMAYANAEDAQTQLKIAMMQKGGKVSAEFQQINDLANTLGNKLPGTTADFQNMMTMLIRQGTEAKNILGGVGEATANIGVLLKMAPEDAAEFSQQLQDATRTKNKDMMGLMDTIQKTFNVGTKQDWMLQAFAKLSPALSVIKKEGLEAANAMAPLLAMANQNGMTDGGSAGNALRKIFQQSMNKDKRANGNEELKGTGISLDFSNGKGEFGGLDKMFSQLEKLRSVSTEKRLSTIKEMFGDDAETLQVLTVMIEKGAAGYAEMQAKMERQASIQERVNAQLGTLKSLWDAATGTFTNALVAFGEAIAPELHATAELVGRVAERVQKWAKENPGLAGTLMTIVKWAGLLALGLGGLAIAASAILVPLAALSFAMATLGIAAAPALAVVGIIAAIAAGAILIYANWDKISAWFAGKWSEIKTAFDGGLLGILALIANWSPIGLFYSAMASVLSYFGIDLPAKFTDFGGMLMSGFASGIMNGISSAKNAIGSAGTAVIDYFKEKLGIRSPSRVFAELGAFTMRGLENGLSGGEDGPLSALAGTARKMAALGAGVALGVSPMANAGTGTGSGAIGHGGDTYYITIQAPPGSDAPALATEIERVLERIQLRKAAAQRSRLRDTE